MARKPRDPHDPPQRGGPPHDRQVPAFAIPPAVEPELILLPKPTSEERNAAMVMLMLEEGLLLPEIAASTGLPRGVLNRIVDSPLGGVAWEKGQRARRRWLADGLLLGAEAGVKAMAEIAGDAEAGAQARLRAAEGSLDRAGMAPPKGEVQINTQVNVGDGESFADRLARITAEARAKRGEGE